MWCAHAYDTIGCTLVKTRPIRESTSKSLASALQSPEIYHAGKWRKDNFRRSNNEKRGFQNNGW
jgi:hypothetical protein